MVECYDLLTRRWLPPSPPPPDPYPAASTSSSDASPAPPCPVRRYPEDAWEHSCVALFVPSSREDIQLLDRYANRQTDEILKHYVHYLQFAGNEPDDIDGGSCQHASIHTVLYPALLHDDITNAVMNEEIKIFNFLDDKKVDMLFLLYDEQDSKIRKYFVVGFSKFLPKNVSKMFYVLRAARDF